MAVESAQTALYEILKALTGLMAPILSFTAEEVWKYLPEEPEKAESVHLVSFPEVKSDYLDDALNERWERIWEIRADRDQGLGRGTEGEEDRTFIGCPGSSPSS